MLEELPIASVQYGDLKGTAALDWGYDGIFDLAKNKGIDTDRYFPLSVIISNLDPIYITIYAFDSGNAECNFDDIANISNKNNGVLEVKKFQFESNFAELKRYIKRISIALNPYKNIKILKYDVIDEEFIN